MNVKLIIVHYTSHAGLNKLAEIGQPAAGFNKFLPSRTKMLVANCAQLAIMFMHKVWAIYPQLAIKFVHNFCAQIVWQIVQNSVCILCTINYAQKIANPVHKLSG